MKQVEDAEYSERRIEAVARRPGGWAVQVAGDCRPRFIADSEVAHPPATGDSLRIYRDERREVVRRQG